MVVKLSEEDKRTKMKVAQIIIFCLKRKLSRSSKDSASHHILMNLDFVSQIG
jgi:hypothetical protein